MTRHLLIFLATFALGAIAAVILRTASHKPFEAHRSHPMADATSMPVAADAPAPMDAHDGHPAMPAPAGATTSAPAPESEHAHHDDHTSQPASATEAPMAGGTATTTSTAVNTICPGCGEPVDPALPVADYRGKKVGFGCALCPPKFTADPVKYGEAALRNQVAE